MMEEELCISGFVCPCGKDGKIKTIINGIYAGFCSKECMKIYSLLRPDDRVIILDKETMILINKKPEYLEKLREIRDGKYW